MHTAVRGSESPNPTGMTVIIMYHMTRSILNADFSRSMINLPHQYFAPRKNFTKQISGHLVNIRDGGGSLQDNNRPSMQNIVDICTECLLISMVSSGNSRSGCMASSSWGHSEFPNRVIFPLAVGWWHILGCFVFSLNNYLKQGHIQHIYIV